MIEKKNMDLTPQKAYFNDVNDCIVHVKVVQELIQHAKLNHNTMHATGVDLKIHLEVYHMFSSHM